MSRVGAVSLGLALALGATLLSVCVQRRGPERVAYGNLCGPTMSDLCYRPVLKGGFPIAYLFDAPGVSVEDQLAFGEDHFRPAAFALDVAAYLAAMLGLGIVARHSARRARRRT